MKRFKRPISEIAKGMFHGGAEGPIIPNLGVKSKKAESSSPNKLMAGPGAQQAIDDARQKVKNKKARDAGKAVSYKDAYADADKKKYKTYEEFEKAAKDYNNKKYGTTNPTADAKKAGKTKEQLAKDVEAKKSETKPAETKPAETKEVTTDNKTETKPVETTKADKIKSKAQTKADKITARKAKRAERKASRVERRAERKENRAANKAARKEGRAMVKAARKGEVETPAKKKKY